MFLLMDIAEGQYDTFCVKLEWISNLLWVHAYSHLALNVASALFCFLIPEEIHPSLDFLELREVGVPHASIPKRPCSEGRWDLIPPMCFESIPGSPLKPTFSEYFQQETPRWCCNLLFLPWKSLSPSPSTLWMTETSSVPPSVCHPAGLINTEDVWDVNWYSPAPRQVNLSLLPQQFDTISLSPQTSH